jgi:dTDP-4-amino-4,6-dideoxygalactose transaminase
MEFRDLKAQYRKYKRKINRNLQKTLKSASFIGGEEVSILEKQLANYVNVKHCISCANGTDAMTLVLDAWNIKEGDAVFIPNFTYFATAEVVAARKATPVFVDVRKDTFNMDPQSLQLQIERIIKEGKLTPKVILTVDLFGLPANYPEIQTISKKYQLLILEDSAQGFGGSINDQKACSFADAATTSFFPAKPLGCYGDGGAIFTNDDKLAKVIESLKVHGKGEDKYDNVRIGYNSRLDTIQAAILLVKFAAFKQHELNDVQRVYSFYDKYLDHKLVIKPRIPLGYVSSFAQYTIILKDKEQRTSLQKFLKQNGIPTFIYYTKTMHQQKALDKYPSNNNELKHSIELANTVLSLPIHPYLKEKQIVKISKLIHQFFHSN